MSPSIVAALRDTFQGRGLRHLKIIQCRRPAVAAVREWRWRELTSIC